MKDRIAYYDFLRGIAIIGVVAIHSSWIGLNNEFNSFNFWSTVTWRQIINFSVPLFLALSGYFIGEKSISNKKEYFNFLKQKLPRVLIPYFLWSLLYLSPDFYHHAPIKDIVIKILTFQTSMPFYFILLIVQFYLLWPFLQKLMSKKGVFISAIISITSCIIILYFRYYTKIKLPFFIYAGAFPTWIIFFTLGTYIRKYNVIISERMLNFFISGFFLLSILETFITYKFFNSIGDAVTAIKFSSFCFSFVLILKLFMNARANIMALLKPVIYIGEISFGIFLSHMFVLRYVFTFLSRSLFQHNTFTLQLCTLLITVLICTFLVYCFRKFNKHISIHYFGM